MKNNYPITRLILNALLTASFFMVQAHADAPSSNTVGVVAGTAAVVGGAAVIAALSSTSNSSTCNTQPSPSQVQNNRFEHEKSCNFTPNNPTPDIPDVAAHPFIIPSSNPANSQVVLIDGVFTGNYRTIGTAPTSLKL